MKKVKFHTAALVLVGKKCFAPPKIYVNIQCDLLSSE